MNAGGTSERVYDALKRRILGREFRPGDRLDPSALADTLASSVTPVRDALHLLTGEGLVETRPGGGFHLPLVDEPGLKDLFDWSADVLVLAIRTWPRASSGMRHASGSSGAGEAVEATARLFARIARRSTNAEHVRVVDAINARLHPVRTVEPHVLGGIDRELDAIAAALVAEERSVLRRLTTAYHRRRRRAAADLVRAIYRVD